MNFVTLPNNLDLLSVGIAVATTGILGCIVIFSNHKSATHRAFLIFSVVTIFWGIVNYLHYQFGYPILVLWLLRLVLFSAVWVAFSLFRLLYIFPSETKTLPKKSRLVLFLLTVLTSILTLTPLVFREIIGPIIIGQSPKTIKGPGIFVFGIVSLGFVLSGLYLLIKKQRKAVGIEKSQLKLLLTGTSLMFLLIITFNFIFAAFLDNQRFIPLGAVFILPFVFATFYAISKHRLLNIKVIATEVLTLIVVIATFFEVLISRTPLEILFRSGIFIFLLAFGVLLIRSVRREVEQREKLEILSKELARANEELKTLDQTKSEFISIAGHQLRAPLTVIKGYVSMTLEGSFGTITEKARSALEKVFISADQLVKLIGDMLNLSRIESGRIQYEFKANDLVGMAKSVVAEYAPEAKKKGLNLVFKNDLGKMYDFVFDKDKMREVIINLIHNAIKYSPQGAITVHLGRASEQADGGVVLSVKDEGVGIKPEDISKLFIKFNRTEEVKTIDPNGMGIGLYFVKRVMEDHGGRARAESEGIGKGSTFIVELPYKR